MGYRITTARQEDVPLLSGIELAAGALLSPYAPAAVLSETTPESHFREALQEGRLWVALAGEAPVGFALAVLSRSGSPHLEELGVQPEHGGKGLGTRLVEAVCAWAARQPHQALTLTTFRDPPFNMPFYRKLGFVEVAPAELDAELASVVEGEARRGLHPAKRVVMRWKRGVQTG